ncbi:MAG TPA: VTT domain-containing protein [Anaerolineales bacterium]|nr:VTT domain-containing protein [Anaerolineales bacterium]HNN12487.1 VTT domain-containing protein [Anaerolineales bacterium]HNO31690.1 VTT domain-containing protein [Anaerolineales bacterium]
MKKILSALLLVIAMVMVWVYRIPAADILKWFGNREAVAAFIQNLGIWGPLVLIVLLVLQVFLAFIPGQALMLACGYVYGFGAGFLISWFGLFAGGEAAFFLARKYGRIFAERWISPQVLSKWDKTSNGQGIGFFATSLVLPVFPNDAMCYVAGLGKISSRRFTLANALGRGLACLLTSAAGAFGNQIGLHQWGIIAVAIVLICLGWLVVRNFKPNWLLA